MSDPETSESGHSAPRAPLGGVGAYLMLGWQIAGAFIVYPAIGFLLDLWLHTRPWLLLAGLVLGLVAVFARIHRMLIDLEQRGAHRTGGRKSS